MTKSSLCCPENKGMRDEDCIRFLQWALPRMGLRWPGFRKVRGQVRKRIKRRLRELSIPDLASYRSLLEEIPDEWQNLEKLCRISISRFYRDQAVFDGLGHVILPAMVPKALDRGEQTIRCLSIGCASGEEPYTISLLWHLQNIARDESGVSCEIIGIDCDLKLLERAQKACYPPSSVKDLPTKWTALAFERQGEEYLLHQKFRSTVIFLHRDIRLDELPQPPFHIIFCRNLAFTYFETTLQFQILEKIKNALCSEGALVLGIHESLPDGQHFFKPWLPRLKIFQKK